jgi:hypothetical protein
MVFTVPAWVKKRDGRVVAFDPDVISQDLFNATEVLGQPDAFLARELTEGVLHFLATDQDDSVPATETIAELIVKVVRELRQPRLAQAFADRPRAAVPANPVHPDVIAKQAVERFTLETVFTRDVAAAHREGLLQLTGLDAPLQLAAAVLSPAADLPQAIATARGAVADWLILDGVEYEPGQEPATLIRGLAPLLQATGLTARVQLNCAQPPPWAQATAHGPLFAESPPLAASLSTAETLLDAVLACDSRHFVVDWHLSERDLEPQQRGVLEKLARAALHGSPVAFSFDRPRQGVLLGPGLDRNHSGLLMTVGLQLPRLLQHAGITEDLELYLTKVASLARLAVSAGVQKRQYLRRHRANDVLERGLLLERARLQVAPLGLAAVIRKLTGLDLAHAKEAVETGRRILQQLNDALLAEGRRRLVDCVLDTPDGLGGSAEHGDFVLAPAAQQLRIWGRLHAVTGTGHAIVVLEEGTSVDETIEFLELACRKSEVARLRFQLQRLPQQEPTLLA